MYIFSLEKKKQIKQKANQTKPKKMLFTSFKNYSRKQYSKKGNSDIVADTQTTQKQRKLAKIQQKCNFSIQNSISLQISLNGI